VVSNSWFARNQAEYQGGAIWAYNSSLAVNTSRLQGNDAPFGGGAIYVTDGTFAGTNVVIAHNTSLEAVGAGIMAFNTDTVMAASAITGNLSGGEGAGLYIDGDVGVPSTALDSCVLAYNTPYNIYALIQDGFSTTVRNNDLYSPNGEPNHNIASLHSTNLTVEPGFMAYDGEGLPEDFHLQRDSLLVDAGSAVQFDPDGSPSDIGAYSGVGAGSYNLDHDSVPDYYWPGRWLEAPVGVDRDAYDCDDLDPDVQGCF